MDALGRRLMQIRMEIEALKKEQDMQAGASKGAQNTATELEQDYNRLDEFCSKRKRH